METKIVQVEVAKESNELGEGLAGFYKATYTALKDGWQVGQDLPVIMTAALTNLIPAVQGTELVASEIKESPVKAASGFAIPILKAVEETIFVKEA